MPRRERPIETFFDYENSKISGSEDNMSDTAKLEIEGNVYELPIIVGTEGEKAIDITKLRASSGYVAMDPGFGNTGSCTSKITFINGEQGILRHHGIPVDQLVEKSSFTEVAYMLLNNGSLPQQDELDSFRKNLTESSLLHRDVVKLLDNFPRFAHPMCVLTSMVASMSAFYPDLNANSSQDEVTEVAGRMISEIRTIAALAYKKSIGEEYTKPRRDYNYCENFLHMMFHNDVNGYEPDPDMVAALDALLVLHADHEQNCSASTVRLVGSSHANLYVSIAAGIAALWGPLHGGANQAVMDMLDNIHTSGKDLDYFIDMAKDKSNPFRLSGFGHRVYKNYDPRARIIKGKAMSVLDKGAGSDPLLEIAKRLEEKVLQDEYFISRRLYPNVDFYSGLLYKAMGIPTDMFTVLFAIGRLPGWVAQWQEMVNTPGGRIGRPRQIYMGHTERDYVPMGDR
jgi:citrate synthase